MPLIILFEDAPDADPEIRKRHMPAHLAFLDRQSATIRAAGPLATAAGAGAGGLWVLDSDDIAAADAVVRQDPFWPTGLRLSYRILRWTQVFADGRRRIDAG